MGRVVRRRNENFIVPLHNGGNDPCKGLHSPATHEKLTFRIHCDPPVPAEISGDFPFQLRDSRLERIFADKVVILKGRDDAFSNKRRGAERRNPLAEGDASFKFARKNGHLLDGRNADLRHSPGNAGCIFFFPYTGINRSIHRLIPLRNFQQLFSLSIFTGQKMKMRLGF